jgi:hypothetical protein
MTAAIPKNHLPVVGDAGDSPSMEDMAVEGAVDGASGGTEESQWVQSHAVFDPGSSDKFDPASASVSMGSQ